MGKLHSKHVCKREGPEGECILGNVHLNPAISSDGSVSHLESTTISISGNEKFNFHHLPLRVVLPPEKDKANMESDTTDNNVHTDKSINVEEFECGVSVEGSSSDKQEWNFTLYDFDGRGKITKEDLARLLQSLYDTVGSSINLPQTGSRTLKLKLSVSPDMAKVENGAVAVASIEKTVNTNSASPRPKKSQSKHHKDRENCRSRERHEKSHGKDGSARVPNNQVFKLRVGKVNNSTPCGAGSMMTPHVEIRNNLSGGPSHSRSPGKRMSSHEQKHLAELIQKNMERNQQRQQHKIRRHNSDQVTKGNNRSATRNVENPDRRNYYLDLAGIENYESSKLHNTTAPASLLDNCSAHGHGSGGHARHHDRSHDHTKLRSSRGHHSHREHTDSKRQSRSRSYDSPGVTALKTSKLEANAEQIVQFDDGREEEYVIGRDVSAGAESAGAAAAAGPAPEPKLQPKSASTPKASKFRPVSLPPHLPETVSPHHHRRHRHRERNHSRAMLQVAEWIDREHSAPHLPCGGEHVVVQKHEHHHIHEHHHHHHYHHYHET